MIDNKANLSSLSWLLESFIADVQDAEHAVVLSHDGLVLSQSSQLDRDLADKLAAASASLRTLANTVSRDFDRGQVSQTHVEMEHGFLFVCAAGGGACLAVLTKSEADIPAVAYSMSRLITQVGEFLTAAPRPGMAGGRA